MKKAYEQLNEIYGSCSNYSKDDFKIGFEKWCISIGVSEEKGNEDLFSYGEVIGFQLLKLYIENNDEPDDETYLEMTQSTNETCHGIN